MSSGQRPVSAAPPARRPRGHAQHARREEGARRADRDGHRLRLPQRPGRRGGRRRRGAGRRLGRDDGARLPEHGAGDDRRDADARPPPCGAGFSTPLLVGDLPFGSYEASNEQAIAHRAAVRQGGRLRRRQARARRQLGRARPRDRRRRHPGDGPRGPHAADGDRPRRLPLAGPHRRAGARGGSRTRWRSRRRAASRSCSRPCPREFTEAVHAAPRDPDHRHRRGPRRPTARCSCSTTCSASTTVTRRAS